MRIPEPYHFVADSGNFYDLVEFIEKHEDGLTVAGVLQLMYEFIQKESSTEAELYAMREKLRNVDPDIFPKNLFSKGV